MLNLENKSISIPADKTHLLLKAISDSFISQDEGALGEILFDVISEGEEEGERNE